MPTPTKAPPEAVAQLTELPEFEMTPDGKVLPAQNQADASTQASQAGAETEAVGSPVEPTQPTPPTQQPAPAAVPPTIIGPPPPPEPVVQVVPPQQPAQAPAPEQPPEAQVTTKAEPTPEELAAAETRLNTFLEEQIEVRLKERQSGFDKRAAQLDRQLQDSATREKELRTEIRQLQAQGLPEEERQKLLDRYAQQDERVELDAYRSQLVDYHKNLYVESLALEFGEYGVKQEALEQVDSPEEMEAFCYETKANYLEAQMNQARQAAAVPPQAAAVPLQAATQVPPPAQPAQPAAAPAPAPQPQPQVPAGALAPADVGSGGAVQPGQEFSQEASQDALRQNLRNMHWKTVLIGR